MSTTSYRVNMLKINTVKMSNVWLLSHYFCSIPCMNPKNNCLVSDLTWLVEINYILVNGECWNEVSRFQIYVVIRTWHLKKILTDIIAFRIITIHLLFIKYFNLYWKTLRFLQIFEQKPMTSFNCHGTAFMFW